MAKVPNNANSFIKSFSSFLVRNDPILQRFKVKRVTVFLNLGEQLLQFPSKD